MSERGKYDAFALIIYCNLFCVPCLAYDPVAALSDLEESHFIDIRSSHTGRVISLRISFPEKKGPLPAILFSHGLGGSRNGYKYVRTCWTARGYATIFLQHPGSDESLFLGVSPSQAVGQLRDAATRKNMNLRKNDVTDVLNAMSVWSSDKKSPFYGRLDTNNIGMAGHSMGANFPAHDWPTGLAKFDQKRQTDTSSRAHESQQPTPSVCLVGVWVGDYTVSAINWNTR